MARRSRSRHGLSLESLERRDCPAVVGVVGDQTVAETGAPVRLTVSLSAAGPRPVTVGYFLVGEATFGRDYRLSMGTQILAGPQGTLSFRPGETSKTITVTPIDDVQRESAERMTFTLIPMQNSTIGSRSATVTLTDNDSYTASIAGPTRVVAGTIAEYRLQLSSPATKREIFYINTVSDSAETPDDYRPLINLPVTFSPGESTKPIRIQVLANQPSETDEVFVLQTTPESADAPAVAPFSTTIIGNGQAPPPWLSISSTAALESNSGVSTMWFTVSLSAPSVSQVTVAYTTADGTATVADQDYFANSGTLSFAPGEVSKTVAVQVLGDTKTEADETLSLRLANPVNARLRTASATGTIRNDDSGPPPPQVGAWTIFVYMTGENLNTFARDDINEMETALAAMPAGVNIVVSWDQPRVGTGQAYATGGGSQPAWRTYGRSVLKADTTPTIASTFDLTLGERNTGDPATLMDFIRWGVQQSPAAHYALQIWGHGGGLDGSQFDSESGGDALAINEISNALGGSGMPRFDLVSYDNCLMAMAEVGYALSSRIAGGVYVASEEVINGTGQDYTTAYQALRSNPASVTPASLATGMITSYQAQYQGDPYGSDTFSTVVSSGFTQLISALSQFVTASDALGTADRTVLVSLATGGTSLSFDVASFRDLGRFMTRVTSAIALPQPIRTAATVVGNALAAMVTGKTNDQRGSSGMSIYLPTTNDSYLQSYASTATAFCQATGWDRFARWLATGSRSSAVATVAVVPQARGIRAGTRPYDADSQALAFRWAAYGTLVQSSTDAMAGDQRAARARVIRAVTP